MKIDDSKMVKVTIEMTEPVYKFYKHAAEGQDMSLGDWILMMATEKMNQDMYKDLTGYEYEEMQKEARIRYEKDDERLHPTLVYNDMIEEWHYERLKNELDYAIEEEWFCGEMVKKAKKLRQYIRESDEIWKAKMSEPVEIKVIREPKEGNEK